MSGPRFIPLEALSWRWRSMVLVEVITKTVKGQIGGALIRLRISPRHWSVVQRAYSEARGREYEACPGVESRYKIIRCAREQRGGKVLYHMI